MRNIASDSVNRAVMESANQIGHAMGIQAVVEFVKNDEILRILRDIGVDFAQGYGVAKPQPMEELFSSISRGNNTKSATG